MSSGPLRNVIDKPSLRSKKIYKVPQKAPLLLYLSRYCCSFSFLVFGASRIFWYILFLGATVSNFWAGFSPGFIPLPVLLYALRYILEIWRRKVWEEALKNGQGLIMCSIPASSPSSWMLMEREGRGMYSRSGLVCAQFLGWCCSWNFKEWQRSVCPQSLRAIALWLL